MQLSKYAITLIAVLCISHTQYSGLKVSSYFLTADLGGRGVSGNYEMKCNFVFVTLQPDKKGAKASFNLPSY